MSDKILTVCRMAQGKKYTPGINLKGDYLNKFGFNVGDMVKVELHKNKIVISKNSATEILTDMQSKNPALMILLDGLNLEVA
jgi:hypothetical protein